MVERLARGVVPGLQAAVATGGAWALAHALGHERPLFAPIAALVALGATASGRFSRSLELTLGVALGLLAGDVVRAGLGHDGWSIGVAVFLATGFARLFDERPLMLTQAGISAVLAVVLDPRDGGLILTRLVDAAVGVAVAVVVAAVVFPPRPGQLIEQALARLRGSMGAVLDECRQALAHLDRSRSERALYRARALDEQVSALEETLDVARETLLFRPLRGSDRRRVAEVREAAPDIDLAVRDLRECLLAPLRALPGWGLGRPMSCPPPCVSWKARSTRCVATNRRWSARRLRRSPSARARAPAARNLPSTRSSASCDRWRSIC